MDIIQIISILVSFFLLNAIFYLIRSNKLKIQYSITWIFASLIILFFSIFRNLLEKLAYILNVYYPPSLLFLMGLIFVILILLHFSIAVSRFSERNKKLSQELSILKNKIENKENEKKPGADF